MPAFRADREFLHEGAVLLEHLDAVVGAVADIDEPVIGDLHAMHRDWRIAPIRDCNSRAS